MSKISSGSLTVVDVKGGSDGINTATIYLYQRATTAPSKPSTNLTYTFATTKLTGGLGSWTQDIGTLTGSDPIWVIAAVASSNGTTDVIESIEWSEPIKMAQDGQPGEPGQPGAKGLNQATIFIYKRDDTATKPNSVTYTFATGSFAVPTGWSTSIPQSNGKPCWVCSAVAIGSDDTAQLNWTNPSVMVEDGSDGVSPVVTSTDNGVQIYDPINDVTYTITNGADGTSYYTHILYSSKEVPTSANDVSNSPENKDYVGILTTNTSAVPAWNDSRWIWKKYIGEDGQPGTQGDPGPQGVSVTGTRELYYLKTNSASVPSITSTSQIDSVSKENGWTSVVPTYVGSGTYYTCIETSLSTGGPVWSTPVENQGLTDANANAAESLSISTHANENAQGALSISRATQQHFWFVSENTGSGASLIEAGAYITDTPIDTFKNGKSGGYLLARSDGLELGRGTNKFMTLSATALNFYRPGTNTIDATLTSKGLVLSKGGIEAGTKNTTNYIYIYSDDDATNHKLTINSHEASDWRIVAGKNFGVDKAGNLYASEANISGTINATHGSIAGDVSIGGNVTIGNSVTIGGKAQSEYLNSNIEVGGRNLLLETPRSHDSSIYLAYQLNLSENLKEGQTYTIQFWDVDVSHTAKTTDDLGVFVFWGGGSVSLINWKGTSYFTNGHADYLTKTFTITHSQASGTGATNAWLEIYNSVPAADGTRSLSIGKWKIEKGNKATDWSPAPEDLAATATNYISADSNGIRIASANPATQNQRIELTNSELSIYSSDNIKRVSIASGTGVWVGRSDKGHSIINDNGLYVYDTNNKLALEATSNGVTVYKANVDVGNFGETARIGKSNGSHFLMNASSLQAFDSSGTKYFEVSSSGISFGNVTQDDILNSEIDIPTKVSELTNDSGYQNSTQVSSTIDEVRSYYIADIDSQNGITIKAVNGETSGSNTDKQNYIKLNADGLDIYKGGDSVAFYGDTARIGKVSSDKIEITPTAFSASNSSGIEGFRVELNAAGVDGWVPSPQDKTIVTSVNSGTATYSDIPSGASLRTGVDAYVQFKGSKYFIYATSSDDLIGGWHGTSQGVFIGLKAQTFTHGESKTLTGVVTVHFSDNSTANYTVKMQYNGNNKITITATPPSGDSVDSICLPVMYYYGTIDRSTAVTVGTRQGDIGAFSVAMGQSVEASEPYSVAFGSYNDANETYEGNRIMLSLGNGTSNAMRSNAFCVDATGDIYIGIDSSSEMTLDGRILGLLSNLGWDGSDESTNIDVIVHFYNY